MSPSDEADEALGAALAERAGGDLQAAIDILRRAASLDLSDATLALNLAKMLAESGQLERAEPWFRHALKLAPDDLDLRLAFGTFLGQIGHSEAAREHLMGVMRDLETALDHASVLDDRAALAEVHRFLGVASVNIGRAALDCGDPHMAISFARGWLDDPEHSAAARQLLIDALDSEALDPQRLAELALDDGRVTVAVVTLLIDSALAKEPPDFLSIERAVAAATAKLSPGWHLAREPLARVLADARARLGRCIMRRELDARHFPALLALQS